MATVHIYSDITGDSRPSPGRAARLHASGNQGDRVVSVVSLSALETAFRGLLADGTQWDRMDFHTHGSPGVAYIGSERLTAFNLDRFRNQRFDTIFNAGAVVEFSGCNAAERPEGELLVAVFGSIFLRARGGSVKSATGLGYADPLFTGDVYHPTGRWITAEVRIGGGVTLRNHRHLHTGLIRRAIPRLQDRARQLRERSRSAATRHAVERTEQALRQASDYIGPEGTFPSYTNVYWAHYCLNQASIGLRGSMAI